LHSLVDFVWYIPATMTLTLILLAALCRLASLARIHGGAGESPEQRTASPTLPPSVGRLEATLLLGSIALLMLLPLVRPARAASAWDSFLVYSTIQSADEEHRRHVALPNSDAAREAQLALLEAKSETLLA